MTGAGDRARRLLVAGLTVAAAWGCTGDDGNPAGPPATSADREVLRIGLPGAIVIDPTVASLASPSDQMVLDLLYGGLTRVDGDDVTRPALAESWEHNDDLTAWRFHLAADATFSSGTPITAADVIASIERVAALGEGSLAALTLEAVTGFEAFAAGDAEHLAGLSAVNDSVVRIALDEPLSVLPTLLATPALGVVDPDSLAADAVPSRTLVLSGGWEVDEADDNLVRLVSKEQAALDVELVAYADADAAYDAFTEQEVDWSAVPPGQVDDARAAYGDDHFAPFHAELFFGLHVGAGPLRNETLRQAIEAAVDRDAIATAVYADRADPLSTVVPGGVPGHDAARCGACGPEVAQARRLVAAAFPDGQVPTVAIDFDALPAQEAMAMMLADDLDAVGIPTELRPLSSEDYRAFIASGDQQLFSFGWIGVARSPDAYLAPLFVSDSDDNLTGFGSPTLDGYLARARAADDPAKNAERWALAEEEIMDATVVLPIAQFRIQVVVADRVRGLEHAVDGTVDWAAVSLAE